MLTVARFGSDSNSMVAIHNYNTLHWQIVRSSSETELSR